MIPLRARLARIGAPARDAVIAVLLLVLLVTTIASKQPAAGQRGGDVLAYLLAVPLTLPFATHRYWPIPSLGVVLTAFAAFAAIGYAAYPGVSLFVIVWGIAAHSDRRRSLTAFGASVVVMVIALQVQPDHVVTAGDRTSSLLALAVAWLIGELQRTRRARWSALEERAALLERERDERDRRAVAEERLRIARDLHDIVAHAMSVIAVQAGTGHHLIDGDPEAARRALGNVEQASRGALVEMRRMLGVLRDDSDAPTPRTPAPGLAKLDELVGRVRNAGLGVSLRIDENIPPLPTSVDLAAYRVVQESLTNVMKHGGPVAFVSVQAVGGELRIDVDDDGPAGGTPGAPTSAGHGLIGMRERVAAYEGSFTASPRPAGGSTSARCCPSTHHPKPRQPGRVERRLGPCRDTRARGRRSGADPRRPCRADRLDQRSLHRRRGGQRRHGVADGR
jgi:signal transduction histidine kinase